MKKVIVIGCPGSGKTTLARRLSQITNLPLVHLDFTYHQMKRESQDEQQRKQDWRQWVAGELAKEKWIIDGNYKSTMDMRIPAADTIIYLDYPRALSVLRTLKRRIQYHGATRPDMPAGWKEHIDPFFFKFIWTYRNVERPQVLALLGQYSEGRDIHILTSPRQAEEFLAKLAS